MDLREAFASGKPLILIGQPPEGVAAACGAVKVGLLGMRPLVWIVEPDPTRAEAARAALAPFLDRRHAVLFGGGGWREDLERFVLEEPSLTVPTYWIGDDAGVHGLLADLFRRRRGKFERIRQRAAAAYAAPPREIRRVLLLACRFTTGLQWHMRDLAAGFEGIGIATRLLKERYDTDHLSDEDVHAALDDFRPDLVVQIDHARGETPGLFPEALPVAGWIVDYTPQVIAPRVVAGNGPRDLLLGMDGGYAAWLTRAGYLRVGTLWPAVDADLFADAVPDPAHASDITICTNVREPAPGDTVGRDRMAGVLRLADWALRLHEERPDLAVAIYGRGWETLRDAERYRPFRRGPVPYDGTLPSVYASARTVVNTAFHTNVHFRVLEVFASGSVPLLPAAADGTPGEVREMFDAVDLVHFRDEASFREAALGLLNDEPRRAAIARRGRERVLADHTYRNRARELLAAVEGIVSGRG